MTDYKKQYFKYKLKYILLKQKNLQFKQKAGSLPTSLGIENMFSEIINYIKNFLPFPINQNDEVEQEDDDDDDDDWDDQDSNVTPPNTPTSLGTRTPPHNKDDFWYNYYDPPPSI